jgi:hypothetical protein
MCHSIMQHTNCSVQYTNEFRTINDEQERSEEDTASEKAP